DLKGQSHRFLEMMLPEEHLYLFSRASVTELFRRLGFTYLQFEPAIFAYYDMFLFAGREPLPSFSQEKIEETLTAFPQGRIIQALLDTYAKLQDLSGKYTDSEADRAARLEVIQRLKKQVDTIEEERKLDLEKIQHLTKNLDEAKSVLGALRQGKVYRILRKIGLWKGMEEQITPILSPGGPEEAIPLHRPSSVASPRREGSLKRIAIDLTAMLPGGENGGAKLLSLELVRHLSGLSPQCEFILLTSDRTHEEISYLDSSNVQRVCVSHSKAKDLSPSLIRERQRLKLRLRGWLASTLPSPFLRRLKTFYRSLQMHRIVSDGPLKKLQPDLLFCPFTLPNFYDPKIPVVSIIYDLQYRYYPQFFEEEDRAVRERNFREACRLADYLVCISEYVRQTVLQNSNRSPAQVISIPIRLWGHLPKPRPEEIPSGLQKYALRENDFLLYPANFWPHKNHPMLFTAFGMYRSRHPESTTRLVCTGSPDKRMESLREAGRRMGLEPWVLFPGYLNEAEFAVLLASCRALIFPSLFEGFGMPLLEAMAFGKPVLSSNLSSLPEIAGGAALLFDPKNPEEIVQAIEKIHSDPQRVRNLVELGSNHLAKWGNEKQMAESYWRVFQEAVGGVRHFSQDIHGVYPDGWTKDEVFVTYGSSPELRFLEIQLEVPRFLPRRHSSITVTDGQTSPQKYTVRRGKIEVLRHPLPKQGGVVELTFGRFQPKAYGLNEDDRWLGSLFHKCSIITGDRKEVLWAR
ncbi:MAG: glycosyltransferase family 1 protein, partial [Deltaproteobacteria bacterium]|nr:glycosyltransferase family 1 protein [Deltaproteobacteria bacterium]